MSTSRSTEGLRLAAVTQKGGILRGSDCLTNLGEGSRSGFDLCPELPGNPDVP